MDAVQDVFASLYPLPEIQQFPLILMELLSLNNITASWRTIAEHPRDMNQKEENKC